jgi:demethylmenaquinone methyltransferase/2-methoxy-6-polyprenyl-1,4-benzoquinol methylase
MSEYIILCAIFMQPRFKPCGFMIKCIGMMKSLTDKKRVKDYFDACAAHWDEGLVCDEALVARIFDNAGVCVGAHVLDVACGTGVLIPAYLARNVASVTGVDLSPGMIDAAKAKYTDPRVRFLCADAEELSFGDAFDCCIVYNALPHFGSPQTLIAALARCLKEGGVLTVAHGASRADINRRHEKKASEVSAELMSADELAALFMPYFDVTVNVSDDRMYRVTGRKRS